MRQEDTEKKVKNAFTNATPQIFNSISEDCNNTEKGKVITMKKQSKNQWVKGLIAIAAVFAIVLSGFGVSGLYKSSKVEVARVSLDVNPGVEIKLNKNDRVLDVVPLNEDGKTVIGEMKLKNIDLDTAVNALIGSMVKNGYLSEIANSILVTVDGKDTEKSAKMQEDISLKINNYLKDSNLEGAVLTQDIDKSKETSVKDLADKCGISDGKAQYIVDFVEENPQYNPEELADCKMNELNVVAQSKGTEVPNVVSKGEASKKAYIGETKAEEIGLSAAGVNRDAVKDLDAELELEKVKGEMKMIYEVEFDYDGNEYEYDIDAVTGEILKSKVKPIKPDKDDDKKPSNPDTENPQNPDKPSKPSKPSKPDKEDIIPEGNYVSKDVAKKSALEYVGLSEDEVTNFKAKLETEKGKVIYDTEFKYDGYEYEFDIDATTGEVLKHKKEIDK